MATAVITGPFQSRPFETLDVVILAGGLGTRLHAVLDNVPKVLAPIGEHAFLDYLLDWLGRFGARRVILCLGYLADAVKAHLQDRPADGLTIVSVIEPVPLGTAGALRLARPHLLSNPVFVMNGDTFFDADLGGFVARHQSSHAGISLLCTEVESIVRYGSLELDASGYVNRFVEKDSASEGPGIISAGMYLFSAASLDDICRRPGASLEHDYLQVLPPGTIRADLVRGRFIDIGTPRSLADAINVIRGAVAFSHSRSD